MREREIRLIDEIDVSLTDGPPSVTYHHPLPLHEDYPGGSAARITLSSGDVLGIGPGDEGKHTALFGDVRGRMFKCGLTLDELDVLIEELQNARAGCFFDEYPAPERLAIPRTCSARELVNFIKDKVKPYEMLRVNALDIDVLV